MKSELEEAKRMIDEGFEDLELLSFELDIPLEILEKYKADKANEANIEKEAKKSTIEAKKVSSKHYEKLEELRKKYYELYNPKNSETQKNELAENDLVDNIINEIVEKLRQLQEGRITGKMSQEIAQLYVDLNKNVLIKVSGSNDNDELKRILKLIPLELNKKNPIMYNSMRHAIHSKISKLTQENAIKSIRNNIPKPLMSIVEQLANGSFDLRRANEIIEDELEKRNKGKKTVFSLNEEQERKQILMQIRMKLKECDIKYPEVTIVELQELSGGDLEQSIKVVIDSLIRNRKFSLAQNICDGYCAENDKENVLFPHISSLRKDIRNAEIGNLILDVINFKGTYEQEKINYEKMIKLMRSRSLKLSSISLGTTKDGKKKILAADLFSDKVKE